MAKLDIMNSTPREKELEVMKFKEKKKKRIPLLETFMMMINVSVFIAIVLIEYKSLIGLLLIQLMVALVINAVIIYKYKKEG